MNLTDNEVIYQILIDRFARSSNEIFEKNLDTKPVFAGGSIRGIINHFNHIVELGCTAIWISPFCNTSAYHGYHTTNFFSVEPNFGTEDDLKELVELVHKNGMKIIADFVPNHVSHLHPYFLEAKENKESTYRDWFYFNKDNSYMCFLHFSELPKLNLENNEARKHILNAARKWLVFGFDGFRLDHVCGPSDNFWKEFIGTLQNEFPKSLFFGEAALFGVSFRDVFTLKMGNRWKFWILGDTFTMSHYRGILPGVLNFEYANLLRLYASKTLSKKQLDIKLAKHIDKYQELKLINFVDNHDMDRLMFIAKNNNDMYKKTLSLLCAENRPIVIYQGTELGVTQDKAIKDYVSYGDLAVRKMFPWSDVGNETHVFMRQLISSRKNMRL